MAWHLRYHAIVFYRDNQSVGPTVAPLATMAV